MIAGTIGGMMRKSRAPLQAPKILLYSVDLCDPKVGNTKYITATSYLDRRDLRQLMKGVKYRYDAVSVDSESNAIIVDLLSKSKNKVVS